MGGWPSRFIAQDDKTYFDIVLLKRELVSLKITQAKFYGGSGWQSLVNRKEREIFWEPKDSARKAGTLLQLKERASNLFCWHVYETGKERGQSKDFICSEAPCHPCIWVSFRCYFLLRGEQETILSRGQICLCMSSWFQLLGERCHWLGRFCRHWTQESLEKELPEQCSSICWLAPGGELRES